MRPELALDFFHVAVSRTAARSDSSTATSAMGSDDVRRVSKTAVIAAAFPDAMVQTCIVHPMRHSLNFRCWKDREIAVADPRRIYSAPTAEAVEVELEAFEEKWAGEYASIAPAWRGAWAVLVPFFALDRPGCDRRIGREPRNEWLRPPPIRKAHPSPGAPLAATVHAGGSDRFRRRVHR